MWILYRKDFQVEKILMTEYYNPDINSNKEIENTF